MLTLRSPSEAYRRIDLDARIVGSGPRELALLCYDRLDRALGQAIHADRRGDPQGRSAALTEALSALAALKLGVDPAHALATAFAQLFGGAQRRLLGSVPVFNAAEIEELRLDFAEIAAALEP